MTVTDVFAEILAMSQHGVDETSLKSHTKLNAYLFKKVLDFLVTYGFLTEKRNFDGKKIFEATDFGLKLLEEPSVSILIPALNEAHNLESVVARAQRYCDEVFLIDGNSVDGTPEIARKLGVSVVTQKGIGKGKALRQGFDMVDSDVVITIDADGSMIAEEIPLLLQSLEENPEIDIVKGSRFLPGGYSEDMSFIRRIGNIFFVLVVNFFWATQYTDLCYGFGAFRKRALTKLIPHLKSQNFEIETEICIKAKKLGLKVLEVPSVEFRRAYGESKLRTIRDGARILKIMLKELRNSRY